MSEIADIYTGKHNLFSTLGNHFFGLFNQAFDRTVATPSPCVRYGTKRAEIIASVLHFQKITGAVVGSTRRNKETNFLRLGSYHGAFIFLRQFIQLLHDIELLFGAQHQIHSLNLSNIIRL